VIDLRTSRPVGGIDTGVRTIDAFSSSLASAGIFGCAVMVIGGLLACFGLRWGAGLAGGAGTALAGWSALSIGLAELPIAAAESIARNGSGEVFTLTITRDLGYWLIVSAGVVGLLTLFTSVRLAGTGRRPSLNPWVAAVGALSTVVFAAGPLIPMGTATFADNFSSPDPLMDLPTAYFAGRLLQLALIAATGVVGFLLVRTWGLGLAAGGISIAAWLTVSATAELGDTPVGVAIRNVGAPDTVPHGVTIAGLALTGIVLLVAGALALLRR
jgi:hypothetical protein